MAAPQIKNEANLKDWLRGRKREDAVAIAARAALRVFPLVAQSSGTRGIEQTNRQFAVLTLASFRAGASAFVAAKYPTRADAADATFAGSIFAFATIAAASSAAHAAEAARAAGAAIHTAGGARAAGAAIHAADAAAAAARAAGSLPSAAFASDAAASAANAAAFAALPNVIWASVADDARFLETREAGALVASPLWAGDLRWELPADQNWFVWFEWYEAISAGREPWPLLDAEVRENLEVAIVSLSNDVWEQGPTAANAAIDALIKATHASAIAAQGPGPRYALGDRATIVPFEYREYDGDGNIPKRIELLLPLTRRAARDLWASLPPNDPHDLGRDTREYLAAIDRDVRQIDWAVVYGLGVFVENAAAEAEREIADRLVPPLEGPAKKALDSLRTLHSNLIMASGEGRALQEQADALRLTREQHQALREDAETIASGLDLAPDVATPAAAATVVRAARQMGQGPHPERGSEFGLAAIGNVSVVLVSAATLASFAPLGFAAGGAVGAAVGVGVAWVGYEGLKKSAMYANATAALGPRYDALQKTADEALRARLAALAPFRRFVRANEAPLRRIAENTSRLRWMLRYIDFIMKPDGERGD
jgi:hypothetical protein